MPARSPVCGEATDAEVDHTRDGKHTKWKTASTRARIDSFRLSSKSHWDVPIEVGEQTVHFLVSHPTPPVFDDPVIDKNGRRNHDEIRFWADYVGPGADRGRYIYDDQGVSGGLAPGSALLLLEHPRVNTKVTPSSPGGPEQDALRGGANVTHLSDPAFDTADISDLAPGNLRADYVLPSKSLRITDAGVFWPASADPDFALVGTFPFPSSDHRLVWVDVNHGGFPRG